MADQRSTLTSAQIDGLMKTRRANKMENLNLEARLKVLDYKKSQAYIQIDIEKDSLRKNIQKIRHVKPDVTGAERRKLLKNGFKRTDASQLPESGDDKLSTEGNENWHSRNERLRSNSGNTEPPVHKIQEVNEQQLYSRDARRKSDTQLNRARHHFRVIDPPSRPGSRRNFLQVSDKVLQKELEQELRNRLEHNPRHDKESGNKNRARARSSSYESVASPKLEALSPIVLIDDEFAVTDIPDAERNVDEIERPQEAQSLQNRLALSPNGGAGNRSDGHLPAVSWSESESDPTVYDSGKGTSTGNFTSDEQNTSSCSEFHVACPSYKLSQSAGTSEKTCENSTEKTVLKEHQTLLQRPKIKCRLSEPAEANSLHKLMSDGRAAEPCFQEASQKNHLIVPGTDSQGPSRTSRTAGSLSMHRRSLSKSCPHLNVEVDIDKACSPRATRAPSPQFSRSRRMEVSNHGGLHNAWTPSAGAPTKTTKKDEGVYAYDARPNKSLSKGYQKMQVTVGRKHFSVYMPRFLDNNDEPVLARIRNKVTNQQFQPRLLAAKHEGHAKTNSKADMSES